MFSEWFPSSFVTSQQCCHLHQCCLSQGHRPGVPPNTDHHQLFGRRSGDLQDYFSGAITYQRGHPQVSPASLCSCFILVVVGEPKPSKITPGQFHYPGSGQEQSLPGAQYCRKVTLIHEGADSWPMEGPLSWGTCPPPVSSYR